jgi:biopolymer transport protein ExbB
MLNSILLAVITGAQSAADTAQSALTQTTSAVPTPEAPTEVSMPLWELIMHSWYIMLPMAILSILTLYYFFERLMVISKASKLDANFMNHIKDYIANGNLDAAKALCRSTTSPVARMIEKGISRIGTPIRDIEEAMGSVGKLEINRMERNLSVLSLIGRIAPILGFIGTILGVIKIFYDISLTDNISIGVISGGLYQKMITSASGLMVGLLAFISYFVLNAILDKTINKMEKASVEFIDLLHGPNK